MLNFSHRGYHEEYPENTLEAFDAAVAMGVEGIETDVRLSRDGKLILFHGRLIPEGFAVKDLTHQELEQQMGYKIPTLEQVLHTWTSVRWDIELKAVPALGGVLSTLRQFADKQRFLVTSFDHQLVKRCAEALEVPSGILTYYNPLNVDQFFADFTRCPPHLRSIVWGYELLNKDLVTEAAARGLDNYVFDLYTPEEHCSCQNYALTGVITDYPQLLCQKAGSL